MTYERCAPEMIWDKLVGIWRGEGSGSYPEIGEFDYSETIKFEGLAKGLMRYSQSTTSSMGSLLHQELGYLRINKEDSVLELIIAQPTGIAEILVGGVSVDGSEFRFELHSDAVMTTPSAKEVTRTGRYFHLVDDELSYQLFMEAVGEKYQLHLEASLVRVEAI